jgi:adenosylcobyric acid synthase
VHIRYVSRPDELRAPDLVVLPGTKTTIPDLLWLTERGLSERIRWLAGHGTPIIGICGGYQMLGTAVHDADGVESDVLTAAGLGLLPVETDLATEKRLVRTRGQVLEHGFGVWSSLAGLPVEGYEIHAGRSRQLEENLPFVGLEAGPEGTVSAGAPVVGTHLHGVLEQPEPRHALIRALAATRGFNWDSGGAPATDPYDTLADVLEATLRIDDLRVSSLGRSS